MVPRSIVVSPTFDVRELAEELDRTLLNITLTGQIEAQIRNTATVSDGKGYYLLYDFLDKGTKPHWIGEADQLLGSKENDFGPVWGPVFHPGTRPFDITARVGAYLDSYVEQFVAEGGEGLLKNADTVQWREIRMVIVQGLLSAMDFAQSITPANWVSVRASYELYLNGRKYQG